MAETSVADLARELARRLGATPLASERVFGLRGSAPALALGRLLETMRRPVVVLAPTGVEAEAFVADLRFVLGARGERGPLGRRVHYLPAWELPPFDALSPGRETLAARAEGIWHLGQTADPVVVTTVEAWAQRVPPRAAFGDAFAYVVAGESLAPDALVARLVAWGHHRVPLVQDPGDVALRGGIVDVFPAGYARPVRLEFFDDEVESIREFDPESQRSLDRIEEVLLLPLREFGAAHLGPAAARRVDDRAAEVGMARQDRRDLVDAVRSGIGFPGIEFVLPLLHETLVPLADHFPQGTLVWLLGGAEVDAAFEIGWRQVEEHAAAAARDGRFHPVPESLFLRPGESRDRLARLPRVEVESLETTAGGLHATTYSTAALSLRHAPGAEGRLAAAVGRLAEWQAAGARVVLVAATDPQRDRLRVLLAGHGIEPLASGAPLPQALGAPGRAPLLLTGELTCGAWLPADRLALVTEAEIFGEQRVARRVRRASPTDILSTLAELKPEDYVVHVDHGIGIYRGLRHMQVADTEGDYLHLEYQDGDRLYVPVDRINVVQRYVSGEAAAPALDKLGGTSWERTKAKARESLLAMAHELVKLYAAREAHRRRPLGTTDALYEEFVARFPFEETADQLRAIDEVLGDLGGEKPMDRLVCGDVGFGKTEVAMRAAFLTVLAGKQVAVLVPTTILAQQHLETFRRRTAGYPITIETLSRFRSAAENRATIARLADRRVDVVIGTHRLLQRDVTFQNLGLLVVDEEHRFGVKDKERIRALRAAVDVLTLTATPIPRTLNMALSGIRDLSVIETPPIDRLAIRTYVTRYDETVIRDAIVRELGRGGQVFFVHNRVQDIDRVAARLGEVVPEARIAVAHGQMGEGALEKAMLAFMHGETNVLVTSAIIESGLDIPRANTVIINRADTFGLAQLYQIRGRVGRSHQRAYAYLLIPGEHLITADAQKRLQALQELDDLGGGFRLAAHDLEIRGAGNLLGKQQSGQITAVGLELYTHMLEQAVREIRGEAVEADIEPEIQLGFPAYIPETYVPDVNQRLILYKRLADVRGTPDLEAIAAELADRYGPIPPLVDTLLEVMDLRRWLKDVHAIRVRRRGDGIQLEFAASTPVRVETLLEVVRGSRGRTKLTSGSTLLVRPQATDQDGLVAELRTLLQRLAGA
ncbi:MAG: transcription-repair coupling factor [Candidatus Binatia bacterium]